MRNNTNRYIYEIKANDKIKWKDTIVIITSDNGAQQGSGRFGPAFGSPLPFRGRKSMKNCSVLLIFATNLPANIQVEYLKVELEHQL